MIACALFENMASTHTCLRGMPRSSDHVTHGTLASFSVLVEDLPPYDIVEWLWMEMAQQSTNEPGTESIVEDGTHVAAALGHRSGCLHLWHK